MKPDIFVKLRIEKEKLYALLFDAKEKGIPLPEVQDIIIQSEKIDTLINQVQMEKTQTSLAVVT